jgi:hypothetical protein
MNKEMKHVSHLPQKKSNYSLDNIGMAFGDYHGISTEGIFMLEYAAIPHIHIINNVDIEKSFNWFIKNYSHLIFNSFHIKQQRKDNKKEMYTNQNFIQCTNEVIIAFTESAKRIEICFRECPIEWINEIEEGLLEFDVDDKINKIGLITKFSYGLDVEEFELKPSEIKLVQNYNDDLESIHEVILDRLQRKNDKGIVLLHGEPGTGKTTYIRYLISQVNKEVIFLSVHMAEHLNSPDFMSFLINHKNSILVIEDAERILTHRDYDQNSAVATLLNLSDGLLSDCLNIQLICSFNTDLSRIDSALLRKGRLIAKYDFKPLAIEKANALARSLGLNSHFSEPTKLTDIYNDADIRFEAQGTKMAIGF